MFWINILILQVVTEGHPFMHPKNKQMADDPDMSFEPKELNRKVKYQNVKAPTYLTS